MERKNIYIVIFVITTIIASCVAVYFAVQKNDLVDEVENFKKQIAIESEVKVENTEENNKDVVEKLYKIPTLDVEKIVNKQDGSEYDGTLHYMINDGIIGYSINSEGYLKLTSKNNEIKATGINEKVVDVIGGVIGQGQSGVVVATTKNGDVYLSENIYSGLEDKELSFEKVEYISNVVKVISTSVKLNDYFGGTTFVAIDSDGICYDLCYGVK